MYVFKKANILQYICRPIGAYFYKTIAQCFKNGCTSPSLGLLVNDAPGKIAINSPSKDYYYDYFINTLDIDPINTLMLHGE